MPTADLEIVKAQEHNLAKTDIEPRFPEDLERLILEAAFDPDDLARNVKMMLVARRARDWIKPLLCRIIFQSGASAQLDFPNFKKHWSTFNIADIGSFVKHVLLAGLNANYTDDPKYSNTKQFTCDLLDHCSNIENLACWWRETEISEEVISRISGRRLPAIRRFSSTVPKIPREVWVGPGFTTLTHLDLLNCPGNWFFDVLASYKSLTHFCVYEPAGWMAASIQGVLDSCSILKVFIIAVATGSHRPLLEYQSVYPVMVRKSGDNRIVLLDSGVLDPEDWLEGAKGRFNTWDFAEWIIEARQYEYFKADHADDLSCAILDMDFKWETHLTPEGIQWYSSMRRQIGRQRHRNISEI
ncbi:hypothetical protein BJ165DRAFT_1532117 [Panaeolus papilionaceus]|nr:hypothetical protein BJ165DRAFT_1532117 [Panaeolus papilionaceus]